MQQRWLLQFQLAKQAKILKTANCSCWGCDEARMPYLAYLSSLSILSPFFHLIRRLFWWHICVVLTVASHYFLQTSPHSWTCNCCHKWACCLWNGCRSRPVYIYYSGVSVDVRNSFVSAGCPWVSSKQHFCSVPTYKHGHQGFMACSFVLFFHPQSTLLISANALLLLSHCKFEFH